MSDLRELYQQVIIDHGRRPRNFAVTTTANHIKDGHNPLCGDKLTLYLTTHNGVVESVTFQGAGCAISMASASLMTEAIKGKTIIEAEALFANFHGLLMQTTLPQQNDSLGKLTVLAGVAEFPARVKCATLAWHTMLAALQQNPAPISTEKEDVLT